MARLDQTLSSIYEALSRVRTPNGFEFESKKSMFRYKADAATLMTNPPAGQGVKAVEEKMLKALATVMAQAGTGGGSCDVAGLFKDVSVRSRTPPFKTLQYKEMKIRDFLALNKPEQMSIINQAWEKVFEPFPYATASHDMVEPTSVRGKLPFPSSWCPNATGGFEQRHKNPDGSAGTPFRTLGIGFRVDGKDNNDLDRIRKEGMTAQILNHNFMKGFRGWEIDGTIVMTDTGRARVWRGNHDLLNESAVCVARNIYGATAFPDRNMVSGDLPFLWAVSVKGLMGVDTESYQTGKPNSRQWRPGEKAFRVVPARQVLAWVRIDKKGAPSAGGWSFYIPSSAKWTPFGPKMTAAEERYINGELDAWKGKDHIIPPEWDFAT